MTAKTWALAALFCASVACSRSAPSQHVETAAASSAPAAIPHSREADDVARFLAGLPATSGSPFAALESTAAWKQHRSIMDAAWTRANQQLIQGLTEFQRSELSRPALERAPVFYPFSGPDVITPLFCFPYSERYVLVALEPAGTLPAASQIEKKDLATYLGAMRKTMASILGKSFFVTREMDREFRGQVTDGLLLPIVQLLVRTGHTVLGFRYIRLDDSGRIEDRPANYHTAGVIGNKGVEIEFTSADKTTHRLLYFSVNLSNSRLRLDPQFLAYAGTLKGSSTLLKATSYMVHKPEFSTIRDLVVNISGAVVQDDSGVPYHFFPPAQWRVQLFGDYQRPYGSFKWLQQRDLSDAYRAGGAKPLPMQIGYGFHKVPSNLILAERK